MAPGQPQENNAAVDLWKHGAQPKANTKGR